MSARTATKVTMARRPEGTPTDDDFAIVEDDVGALDDGSVMVQVDTLSIDAFIRTTMNSEGYHQSAEFGSPIPALGVGTVLESTDPDFAPGDVVNGPMGAQTIAVMPAAFMQKIDTSQAPASAYLGALGLTTGMTAYFGIFEVGAVAEGDTVVVSGAAGGVGSMAGQLAKIAGADKVIGIAGGQDKVAYLTEELGYDAGIDYRNENVAERLDAEAPDGINVFFDNVGGPLLDTVLVRIAEGARIVICGAISQYENMDDVHGPKDYLKLAERHSKMEGFAVTHFVADFPKANADLAGWLASGDIRLREHIEHGIERFPAALRLLMTGGHYGKLLLQVS